MLFLFLAQFALATPITLHGVTFEADSLSYYVDSNLLHSFRAVEPVTLPFIDGNKFPVRIDGYVHRNGNISTLSVMEDQDILWKRPDGKSVRFACTPRYYNGAKGPRMVSFHENRQYKMGCDTPYGEEFIDAAGSKITVFASLEVSDKFELRHAGKIGTTQLKLPSNPVTLLAGTELNYHANGKPRFFTLVHGEVFTAEQGKYGKIKFTQKEGKHVSTTLFENGSVERGILAEAIQHQDLPFQLEAGIGVSFDADLVLTGMIFSSPKEVQAKDYKILVDRFMWDRQRGFYNLNVAEDFFFVNPENNDFVLVPRGSLVGLNLQWEIIGIQVPRKQE